MEAVAQEELAEMDRMHKPSEVEDLYGEIPDGDYIGRLESLMVAKSRSNKNQTIFEFELTGKYTGRKVWKYCQMSTPTNLDYLTIDLRRVGIKDFKWETVQTQFKNALDKYFEITIKTKGEFQNVYIQSMVSPPQNTNSPTSDNDLPF